VTPFQETVAHIHAKRRSFQELTGNEFTFLLADCILDKGFFSGPNWNWRFGGVRYVPQGLPPNAPERILVLQWPGNLGDVCMSGPFFSVLRQKYPESEISFLSGRVGAEIFLGNPDIDLLLENPLERHADRVLQGRSVDPRALLKDTASLADTLREAEYDLVINLQVLPMSAALARLATSDPTTCTIGMTLTRDGMPVIQGNPWAAYLFGVSASLLRNGNSLHRTEIFRLLIDGDGSIVPRPSLHLHPAAVERVQRLLDSEGVVDQETLIGLNPMAGTPIRQWRHYAELAGGIRERLHARLIVFGSRSEEPEIDRIFQGAGHGILKATRLDLQELMAAVSACDLFITNDTGPMHLASLLGRKTLALFGPTSFREVGPWQTEFHVLQSALCRECYRQTCARPENDCMGMIPIELVLRLTESLILGGEPPALPEHLIYEVSAEGRKTGCDGAAAVGMMESLFRLRNPSDRGRPPSLPLSPRERDRILRECREFKKLLMSAIRGTAEIRKSNPGDCSRLYEEIRKADTIFKPFLMMNDLEFLDKRVPLESDVQAYRKFCAGLLGDIEAVAKTLTPSASWNGAAHG
jgi:heptosyltransferase II